MVNWGKRKDGQAYPKTRNNKSKKQGSIKSSGIKLKPQYVPTKENEEQKDQKLTRVMIIDEYKNTTMTEIMIKPSDFLRATNNDRHWIPFDKPKTLNKLKNRMENQLPIDVPILVYDPDPKDPNDFNATKYGQIDGHEGRHRAYVAVKEHIPEILVDVYCVKHNRFGHNCNVSKKVINAATAQSPNDKEIDAGRLQQEKEWEREIAKWTKDNTEALKGRRKVVAVFGEKLISDYRSVKKK